MGLKGLGLARRAEELQRERSMHGKQINPVLPLPSPSLTPSPSMCYLGLIGHVQNLYSYAGQILGGRRQRK